MEARSVPTATYGFGAFTAAPCMVIKGKLIPRRVVIKYVSNKLGGAHHDPRRGKSEEELLFSCLDRIQNYLLMGKPAVYFELLSAGQALVRSTDIGRLVSKVRPAHLNDAVNA